jgi:hypothetical protein
MTPEQLEFLSKLTMKTLASLENLEEAHYYAYKSGIDSGRYKNINPLDTIPMEDINNPRISVRTLRKNYNPNKEALLYIIKYRRENGIQHRSKYNPISVIPLEQLNNPDIYSSNSLSKKYDVSFHAVREYRIRLSKN